MNLPNTTATLFVAVAAVAVPLFPFSLTSDKFESLEVVWWPQSAEATLLNIIFTPADDYSGAAEIVLDNVKLEATP